jgi:hypothetical protein
MGLFDTVASVGIAGLYSFSDGHMAWANGTMQIHPLVGKCVHLVAEHEMRACFPLDSVRVNGEYRGNVEEIVYPGAHSDLGGGYFLRSLGKNDLGEEAEEEDLQIARVPGFDMYTRALAAGVPFYTLDELEKGFPNLGKLYAKNLLPAPRVVTDMDFYDQFTGSVGGSVEEQLQGHAALYLGWRWSMGKYYFVRAESLDGEISALEDSLYVDRLDLGEMQKTKSAREENKAQIKAQVDKIKNKEKQREELKARRAEYTGGRGTYYSAEIARVCGQDTSRLKARQGEAKATPPVKEADFMEKTQREIIQVVAGYCREIDSRIAEIEKGFRNIDPLENPLIPLAEDEEKTLKEKLVALRDAGVTLGINLLMSIVPGLRGKVVYNVGRVMGNGVKFVQGRLSLLEKNFEKNAEIAARFGDYLEKWKRALGEAGLPIQHDESAPEREGLLLLEGIQRWQGLPQQVQERLGHFFAEYVHDSQAGFRDMGMLEFEANGYGLAKFRTVYFGDEGDDFLRQRVKTANKARREQAAAAVPPKKSSTAAA